MRALHPAAARPVALLLAALILSSASPVTALDVGEPAPDFSLPATTGGQISLRQFHGEQPVLLEFYSADFAPV